MPNTHSSALPAGLPAPFRDLSVLALVLLLDAFQRARLRGTRALVLTRRRARTASLLTII